METVKTMQFSNGVCRLHFPDLTEEERAKRRENLKRAVTTFAIAVEREKGEDIWDRYAREREERMAAAVKNEK